ncbi:MAG: hypothetical protein JWL71_4325 [Acidobacteria bacterium]|nr:hypothetical protein [Acidobacteriota bacterium]
MMTVLRRAGGQALGAIGRGPRPTPPLATKTLIAPFNQRLAAWLQPQSYLEIGVNRGRGLAMVASVRRSCQIVACDMFIDADGGMDTPGPPLVTSELARAGFTGQLEFVIGDSHRALPSAGALSPFAYDELGFGVGFGIRHV